MMGENVTRNMQSKAFAKNKPQLLHLVGIIFTTTAFCMFSPTPAIEKCQYSTLKTGHRCLIPYLSQFILQRSKWSYDINMHYTAEKVSFHPTKSWLM